MSLFGMFRVIRTIVTTPITIVITPFKRWLLIRPSVVGLGAGFVGKQSVGEKQEN